MSSSSIFGNAAAPITISGLSSGLDTQGIITQLTNAESGAMNIEQARQNDLNTALTAWQSFNGSLIGLQSIASSLSAPAAFNTTTATIDQSSVASVSAQPGASVGSHTLVVSTLAASQKVLSAGFSDPSVPLNLSGSFVLNGKAITVASSDTLSGLVAKINGASAGVQASVVSASSGNYQLSIASSATGTLNALSASDAGGGTLLESLGLLPSSGATVALRQSLTRSGGVTGAGSLAFANSTQPIGTLLSSSGAAAPSGTVTIAGTSVNLNLATMSLSDVANAINAASIPNVQAQIVGIPDASGNVGPNSQKQLQIVSTSSGTPIAASSFTDSGGVLSSLGIVQTGFANQISAAADATFKVDGISYTRSSNTVNDAIQSVSINLLSANSATTANVSVSADTTAVMSSISNFVKAYNGVNDYINGQFAFTPQDPKQTGGTQTQSPPLFGNFTLTNIQNQLTNMLGVNNGSATLASIGISVDSTGDLQVNTTTLQNAIVSNPTQVAGLFGLSGSATGSGVKFITASVKTQASSAQGYAVNITQAASQASVTAAQPFQAPTAPETLTFTGGLFGTTTTKLTLPTGTTVDGAIALINGDTNISQFLYAAKSATGALVLSSKGYGSAQSFTVSSDNTGAGGTGLSALATTATGTDVQGTINGEAATGVGQSLTGNSGNKTTDGLQLLVSSSTTGALGTVTVGHGLADQLNALVTNVTDPINGSITAAENSVNSQISDIQTQIQQMQTQLSGYQQYLTQEFAAMEQRVSQLKSQQTAFAAELGTTVSSSSSGTSSSSSSSSSGH